MNAHKNIFTSMQSWLKGHDAQVLGYNNSTRAQKAKKCFCKSKHLLEFLDKFSYDLVYSSIEYFLAVAKYSHKDLGVREEEFSTLLRDTRSKLDNLNKLRKACIYIKTNFSIRRNTAPLHALAFAQGSLWLGFVAKYKDATLSPSDILRIAQKMVATHYTENNGEVHLWGKILEYYLYYDGKRYVLDTQGNLSPQADSKQGAFSFSIRI